MTPIEAQAAIDAGHAKRLMLDYWTGEPPIFVLCPSSQGHAGKRAKNTNEIFGKLSFIELLCGAKGNPQGRCTLLKKGLCAIHSSGYKPIECRTASHDDKNYVRREEIQKMWDNSEAQSLARKWMKLVDFNEDQLAECT